MYEFYSIERNYSGILECTTDPAHSAETKLIYSTNKKRSLYFYSLTLTTTYTAKNNNNNKKPANKFKLLNIFKFSVSTGQPRILSDAG